MLLEKNQVLETSQREVAQSKEETSFYPAHNNWDQAVSSRKVIS